jgi:hypothetical protein
VVDEVAIGRPLDLAEAREAAVHRIAEPLHGIAKIGQQQPARAPVACGIAHADERGTEQAKSGQPVGRDPSGHAGAHANQQAALAIGQNIPLDALELASAGV